MKVAASSATSVTTEAVNPPTHPTKLASSDPDSQMQIERGPGLTLIYKIVDSTGNEIWRWPPKPAQNPASELIPGHVLNIVA